MSQSGLMTTLIATTIKAVREKLRVHEEMKNKTRILGG
jgi:hypothetical protein